MHAVDWVLVGRDAVATGDLVSAEPGGMPIYRVVAVENGQALLQDEDHEDVRRLPLDRLLWKARPDQP